MRTSKAGRARNVLVACLALAGAATLAGCSMFFDDARLDELIPGEGGNFAYSVMTNTVMTANSDGAAERLRRDWLAESLHASAMCPQGYVIDGRRYEVAPNGLFGADGGAIIYQGHCL